MHAERIHSRTDPNHTGDPFRRLEILSLLENKRRHKPNELSGGEQQRVALARAVANRPSILLADEPTGNLASNSSDAVLEMLRSLNREMGQTIVMITHNREAADYSERTIRMNDGRITVDTSLIHFWDNELPQKQLRLG